MKIKIQYRDAKDEKRTMSVEDIGPGQPLAEKVRLALDVVPDGGYAVAVYVDGEREL